MYLHKKTNWYNGAASALSLFVLYLLVSIVKSPTLFSLPRFWAEDGVIYYLQARSLPVFEALWGMPLAYLSLPPNLAGILATQLPLFYAPYANLIVSLSIQLLLVWVVLSNQYFADHRLKQVVLLLIPIMVIQSFETWLNTINSQVWFALIAAYILAAPMVTPSLGRYVLNTLILLLASLSGVVAVFLSPLFLLRAILERKLIWVFYTLPLSIGGVILLLSPEHSARSLSFPVDIFAVRSFIQIILDNLCLSCAFTLSKYPSILDSGYFSLISMLLLSFAYGLLWRHVTSTGRWLLSASLLLLLLSFVAALGKEGWLFLPPHFGARYFFAPAALFFSSLLFVSSNNKWKVGIIFVLFFINSIVANKQLGVVGEYDGKSWRQSVNDFKQGNSSIIYFNKPFCGFSPIATSTASVVPTLLSRTSTEFVVNAPNIKLIKNPKVFLYRFPTKNPNQFQYYKNGIWEDSHLYLIGTAKYGHCYGGDEPVVLDPIKVHGNQITISRKPFDHLSDYRFLFGYGENFAAMLANKTYVYFNGSDVK